MTKPKVYRCTECGEIQIGPGRCKLCEGRTRPDSEKERFLAGLEKRRERDHG